MICFTHGQPPSLPPTPFGGFCGWGSKAKCGSSEKSEITVKERGEDRKSQTAKNVRIPRDRGIDLSKATSSFRDLTVREPVTARSLKEPYEVFWRSCCDVFFCG